jgi:hypothetical protein
MITARLHPSDAEHAIEREALTIAVMNGPAVLTRRDRKKSKIVIADPVIQYTVDA